MADRSKDSPGLPIGNLATVLLFVLGVVIPNLPLESGRPKEVTVNKDRALGHQDVDARMWQDPFEAAVLHRQNRNIAHLDYPSKKDGKSYTFHDAAYVKGVAEQELRKNCRLVVLGVMVPAGSYAEDAELRRRQRYALLSGMGTLGLSPDDPEHIGYLALTPEQQKLEPWLPTLIPLEWINSNGPLSASVLLMWIEEEAFSDSGDILKHVNTLLNLVTPQEAESCAGNRPPQIDYKIIGPGTSGTLRNMLKEAANPAGYPNTQSGMRQIEFYSATATMSLSGTQEAALKTLREKKVFLTRMVSDDGQLAEALVAELVRRRIHPGRPQIQGRKDYIALISEWDTVYGQQLPLHVVEASRRACRHVEERPDTSGCEDKDPDWALRFSYLRGLDGETTSAITPAPEAERRNGKDDKAKKAPPVERAEGNSQFDYLRRIAQNLAASNVELKRSGRGEIKAVGVLGSDFYDKMLILQALRKSLPQAVFFTTDLDARYIQSDEHQMAHNLIVASSFGLELAPELQQRIPPFRDSYQTASYLATLVAFSDLCKEPIADLGQKWLESPRLFEIGRTRAVDLSIDAPAAPNCTLTTLSACANVHHRRSLDGPRTTIVVGIALIVMIGSALLAFCNWNIKQALKKYWPRLVLAYLAGMGLWWLFVNFIVADPAQEPLLWFESVSIWPTTFIRLIAFAVATGLIVRGIRTLAEGASLINERFFPDTTIIPKISDVESSSWKRAKESKDPVIMLKAWQEYLFRSQNRRVALRVAISASLFIMLSMLLVITDMPVVPCRGQLSCAVDTLALVAAVIAFIALLFFVLHHIRLCDRLVRVLYSGQSEWPDKTYQGFRINADPGREWVDIQFVAMRTEAVGRLIYHPFIVLVLLLVARSTLFDNWHLPPGLAAVFALSFLFAVTNAVQLRRSAEYARAIAEQRLSEARLAAITAGEGGKTLREQAEALLSEVRAIQTGAFRPFTQQPLAQAILIPLGGYGGISLIEYFAYLK